MVYEATINLSVVGATCFLLIIYLIKFVYRYKHQYESNPLCTFAVIFCLLVVLLITCILPVDIFLVSFVKNPDGSFKDWATREVVAKIDNVMFLIYYTLYGSAITLIFLLLPFLHFFNDETNSSSQGRLNTALKYTSGFFLIMIGLLFAGAFIHTGNLGPNNIFDKLLPIKDETKAQSSISFVLTIITILGFINVSFYTASGIFSWPIGLLLGTLSLSNRYDSISDQADLLRTRVSALRQKAQLERLSEREREQLTRAEDELLRLDQEESVLSEHRSSLSYKLRNVIRPIQMFFGVLLSSLSIMILATLIIVNVDRILHSAGPKQGYILPKPIFFNPLEYVFTKAQDLIFIGPMPLLICVCFLVVATISGIRNLGLWFMFARLYRIKVRRTPPQALLFFCMSIMLAALAFNLLLYSMTSQYITFGDQNYRSQLSNNQTETKQCTIADYHNDCLMTRTSILLMRMMSQLWVFGVIFYWSSWIFVTISSISLVAYLYRGKRQAGHDRVAMGEEFED